ncbi:hypothetical protein GW17_00008606 [Ensete ventricosum]|nr:hypothetical protein GW17_00008606 [Ensete ventricosum]
MMQLSPSEGEELLTLRWLTIPGSARVCTEGPLAMEYLQGALHPVLVKQLYECFYEELMNRIAKSVIWEAWDDRARLKEDVLSLIEAIVLLKKEPKAVTAYKASCGFESDLEKMWCISFEFGYHVALERFHAKHSEAEVKVEPLAECPEDDNVMMDLW